MKTTEKTKQKKKKVVIGLSALALAGMIAGTFAWTSYTDWKENHMQSRGFETGEVTISESFPSSEIGVGATLIKDINVTNASDSNVFVRVKFEEQLAKLKTGAVAKGYQTLALAKFPVIIDHTEYLGAGWTEEVANNNLLIDNAAPTKAKAADEGYKLYVNGDKKILVYVRELKKADLPSNFKYDAASTKIPLYSGTWANDDVQVAQKVTGDGTKLASNQYNFTTGTAVSDLKYFGYGEDVEAATEENWAGTKEMFGTTAKKPADPTKSVLDNTIEFAMANVDVSTINAKDWYYDKTSGYFYYTHKLAPSAKTLSSVLQSVKFPGVAGTDDTYGIAAYDLNVKLEAIPAYLAAMEKPVDTTTPQVGKGSGGWGLSKTDAIYAHFAADADPE